MAPDILTPPSYKIYRHKKNIKYKPDKEDITYEKFCFSFFPQNQNLFHFGTIWLEINQMKTTNLSKIGFLHIWIAVDVVLNTHIRKQSIIPVKTVFEANEQVYN